MQLTSRARTARKELASLSSVRIDLVIMNGQSAIGVQAMLMLGSPRLWDDLFMNLVDLMKRLGERTKEEAAKLERVASAGLGDSMVLPRKEKGELVHAAWHVADLLQRNHHGHSNTICIDNSQTNNRA